MCTYCICIAGVCVLHVGHRDYEWKRTLRRTCSRSYALVAFGSNRVYFITLIARPIDRRLLAIGAGSSQLFSLLFGLWLHIIRRTALTDCEHKSLIDCVCFVSVCLFVCLRGLIFRLLALCREYPFQCRAERIFSALACAIFRLTYLCFLSNIVFREDWEEERRKPKTAYRPIRHCQNKYILITPTRDATSLRCSSNRPTDSTAGPVSATVQWQPYTWPIQPLSSAVCRIGK